MTFCFMYRPHFVYRLNCWHTFGLFCILTIVNNSAINTDVLFKFLLSVLLCVYLEVELAGSYCDSGFQFFKNQLTVSHRGYILLSIEFCVVYIFLGNQLWDLVKVSKWAIVLIFSPYQIHFNSYIPNTVNTVFQTLVSLSHPCVSLFYQNFPGKVKCTALPFSFSLMT